MGKQRSPEQLAKFLSYILERRPDEFGLILDQDGYVKIKELLKAVGEVEGWRYARRGAIEEVRVTLPNPPIEMDDHRIRAKNRDRLPKQGLATDLPKLLYTCVRRKAHRVVLEKGIFPQGYPQVILSSNQKMAERMGRRADSSPILLTVQTRASADAGVVFHQAGETLFLADFIPSDGFTGPPIPKEKAEMKKPEPKTPGSFFPDLTEDKERKKQNRKKAAKEKDKRRMRREKQKMWPGE